MSSELAALSAVNLDWTQPLQDVWTDLPHDIEDLHRDTRNALGVRLDRLLRPCPRPEAAVIMGDAGTGKTHLISALRREAYARNIGFILVDMSMYRDFWDTMLLSTFKALMKPGPTQALQFQEILEHVLALYGPPSQPGLTLEDLSLMTPPGLINVTQEILGQLMCDSENALTHQDAVRALVLLNSKQFTLKNVGFAWLQGLPVDEEKGFVYGFQRAQQDRTQIFAGISWLASLRAPMVIAFDQLDSIIMQHATATATDIEGELHTSVIHEMGQGFMALWDNAERTQIVMSCLPTTWERFREDNLNSVKGRFTSEPLFLPHPGDVRLLERVVTRRLRLGYDKVGFHAPFETWPFLPGAFAELGPKPPRSVLQACDAHIQRCRYNQEVHVLASFADTAVVTDAEQVDLEPIDAAFKEARASEDPSAALGKDHEDQQDRLVEALCACVALENPVADNSDLEVVKNFTTSKSFDPLHAKLRLIDNANGAVERHLGFRFLEHSHHNAFQARLKAAMTESGIDLQMPTRKLVLFRSEPLPTTSTSKKLLAHLEKLGGKVLRPSTEELKTMAALANLLEQSPPPKHFDRWLETRKPASKLSCIEGYVAWLFGTETPNESVATPPTAPPEQAAQAPASETPAEKNTQSPPDLVSVSGDQKIPIGRERLAGSEGAPVELLVSRLLNHVVVLAGSGSGKTVFVRRLVEEAALLGVPSIVLDGANDLARLGDSWPEPPSAHGEADKTKAGRYAEGVEVLVFTPGIEKGNPLSFQPLPDLSLLLDDNDEYKMGRELARTSLQSILVKSGRCSAPKLAVLDRALDLQAKSGGGGLERLLAILSDPPNQLLEGYAKADKLVQEWADSLRAEMQMNRLLSDTGAAFDPGLLFGAGSSKTRISVVNLIGLPELDSQRTFVDQLAQNLFGWVKKNPAPSGSVRGLLVIDEAKDFVPSGRAVPSSGSLKRLAAQARKYGLGLVFATQEPKSIDHHIISNSKTKLFGKQNSPAGLEVVQAELRDRGGSGHDIAKLPTGVFYAYSEGFSSPLKVQSPLCLSYHPSSPLDEAGVLERARRSRDS